MCGIHVPTCIIVAKALITKRSREHSKNIILILAFR